MNHISPPNSPFTTRLSGSARETELRIRSIFQWKKERPPAPLIALVLTATLLCGGLVSCRVEAGSPAGDSGQSVRDAMAEAMADEAAALDGRDSLVYEMPASVTRSGNVLAALSITDSYPHYYLGIGVVGGDGQLTGPLFTAGSYGGMPHAVTFQKDGADYLLYTANGMGQGLTWGEAGLIRFDGSDFTWVWPVEGDIRDTGSQAFADYQTYWEDHLALMAPGGLDVYCENGYYDPASELYGGAQWMFDRSETFCSVPEDVRPADLYDDARIWLEWFSRYQHDPWDRRSASAGWLILSLTANSWVYPDQTDGQQCYTLLAQADRDDGLYMGVHLVISKENGGVCSVHQYVQGDYDTVTGRLAQYDESAHWDPAAVDALPIPDGGLELQFCSGAGAWQTVLTLDRDGSFTGEYRDDDMGVHTAYVCSFRGRFGHFQQLTNCIYSLVLDELELTTGRPVGEEWTEGGTRYVSSQPYGLEGGPEFRFYTPETPAMELPGPFLLWYNGAEKDRLLARTGTLGCYGLYDRSMGYGSYSYEDR